MSEKTRTCIGTFDARNFLTRFKSKTLNRNAHIGRFHTRFLGLLALAWIMPAFASKSEINSFPCCLRLRFDTDTCSSDSCLWERKILSGDSCWAQESTATDTKWKPVPRRKVKVGVALGGGIVRGIAHIGVLRALEENNVPIHAIAGTSMGAIIGGLYASGIPLDTLEKIVKEEIKWKTLFSDQPSRNYFSLWGRLREKHKEPGIDVDVVWNWKWWPPPEWLPSIKPKLGTGLSAAQKFTDEIAKRTLEADYRAGFDFDSLPIPYGAILTDMNTGKSKLMRKGTVSTAARASGSFPVAFEPMKIGDTSYVDGGVLNNLPVDAFIRFDTIRAPMNTMKIDSNPVDYVIAVYPSERRGAGEKFEEESELSGFLGIGVVSKAFSMAREYHVWNSWDCANAKIDVDVEGGFDFFPEKIKEVIRAGYCSAWKEIYQIKREIAAKEKLLIRREKTADEDSLKSLKQIRRIHRVSSMKLKSIIEVDTIEVKGSKERERVLKAIKLKEGSYVEKIDICDALKRIYDLGDFRDVRARIDTANADYWALTFFLEKEKSYSDSLGLVVNMDIAFVVCDTTAEETSNTSTTRGVEDTPDKTVCSKVCKDIHGKKRILNFDEIKELVEKSFVEQGFVSPRVDSVRFRHLGKSVNALHIYGNKGTRPTGVKINCGDTLTEKALQEEFKELSDSLGDCLGPRRVRDRTKDVYKGFQLKTIAVQGFEDDSLIIAAARKSTHTLEIPSVTLETFEGGDFFAELRRRNLWKWWSPYTNFTLNFPLRGAQELPQGHRTAVGLQRCRSSSKWDFLIPELSGHWTKLRFSSEPDTLAYNKTLEEVSGQLAFPIHFGICGSDFACIPGLEASKMIDERFWKPFKDSIRWYGDLWLLRYDNLDRIIFPESGWKVDVDAKVGGKEESSLWKGTGWSRARIRILGVPLKHRIQKKTTTVLTMRLLLSGYSEKTPDNKRYSLGGLTPIGSYQLKPLDSEDLHGYERDEIIEPAMWKAGASLRIAFMERSVLGLRFNIHGENSLYFADAAPWDSIFSGSRQIKVCPAYGLYLDTSILNIGWIIPLAPEFSLRRVPHHLSVVFYGI